MKPSTRKQKPNAVFASVANPVKKIFKYLLYNFFVDI